MTTEENSTDPIQQARSFYRQNNKRMARFWAERAVALDPGSEEAWLWLAAVSNPETSLKYLRRALEVNPNSTRARQGMHWAIQRLRQTPISPPATTRLTNKRNLVPATIPSASLVRPRFLPTTLITSLLLLTLALVAVFVISGFSENNPASAKDLPLAALPAFFDKATRTPTFTPTFTPTSTPTNTPTFTPTFTPTPTDTPTETPLPTDTPVPTDTPIPTDTPMPPTEVPKNVGGEQFPGLPEGVGESDHWIDVNLSQQMAYAYQGNSLVNSFLVSTGTYLHPTVTGTYQIYVKYRYADMSGPGYYLPNVPYVMYFYQGYGLHGTYWHNNFGHPMSHGCVNFRTEDAGWVFNWTEIGTVVNVHY